MALEFLISHDFFVALILICLTTMVIFILLPKIVKFVQLFRYFQNFPGEPNYSIIYGNLHKLPKDAEKRISWVRNIMDNVNHKLARFWFGPFRVNIATFHPDTVKIVLKSSVAPKPRGFGQVYEHAIPWIGEGLISSNGATWARSRRLLTPAFHFDILKPYVDIYNQASDILFEKLDKYAETGESFDICPPLTLCTLDVILRCAMGYDVDVQRQGQHPYAQAVKELLEGWSARVRTLWLWPDFIFRLTPMGRRFFKNCDYVHKVAEEVIEKRRQTIEKGGLPKGRHLDFLDILLTARDEDGNPMTALEIRNEVDTFLFAGHDTTASAIPWILYTLAQNPEYQTKVQAELDEILERKDSDKIEWSDLSKLQLLPMCIREAMRLYPPVPLIQRKLTENVIIDGRVIPAGTNVTVAIIHLHRNSAVWEEPDAFKPERFSTDNMKERDSYAFTPFSAGSRNCIGQSFALNEEKVIVGRILQRYDLELAPDGPPVKRIMNTILKSEMGIWLRIKHRQR